MPTVGLSKTALTTLEAVRVELKLKGSEEDWLLEQIINAASRVIENHTRRKLRARGYQPSGTPTEPNELLKLNGRDRLSPEVLVFPQWPLNTVTAVTIKDDLLKNPKTLDLATDLVFDPVSGEMRLIDGDTWLWGIQNIEATVNAGYTDVPEDLDRACVKQGVWEFRAKDRATQGILSVAVEGQAVSYFMGELLPEVKKMLAAYVRPLVGRGAFGRDMAAARWP